MEFGLPAGQVDNMNFSMRYAFENSYVAKAMKLKTLFTTKGVQNNTGDDVTNDFLDQVHRKLYLRNTFRQAVWLYYTCGLVPILLPEKDKPLDWVQILDPRMVRTERMYGKTVMYLVADARMKAAVADSQGRTSPLNKDYYDAMPRSWRKQIIEARDQHAGDVLIRLEPESYIVIQNRYNPCDRNLNGWDGSPLQPYFSACENYRMLMAGDFATAFLAKNIIALASVGDPKLEGDNYIRPDDQVLAGLQNVLQTPNQAMWLFGDPTLNIRYITPGPEALDSAKYAEWKSVLKNLLPGPFWTNDSNASFADATVELQQLEEEAVACQNQFDDDFWTPIHERAAEGRTRIASKNVKPPQYDRSALRDRTASLKEASELYNNGGLSVASLQEAHGIDPEVEKARLTQQKPDAKKGVFMPAFEGKQGIVSNKTYGIKPPKPAPGGLNGAKPPGGKGGRPTKPGSKPQAESTTGRTPRPSAGK
jgi:hypothetical protein